MSKVNLDYLWTDRRRRLGMPLSFTRYALSNDRLFLDTGLLNTQCDEILLYRVRDISLNISLFQRIFGVGSITITSSDRSLPTLVLKNIKRPREVKELIHNTVEKMKIERRMRVGEIMNYSYDPDDDDDHDDWDDEFMDQH